VWRITGRLAARDGRHTTLLAYYDAAGQVVEAEVSDVCEILARIRDHVTPYGGSVELEPTQEPTAYDFQIDAEGIRLDALLDPSGA
jgi:hypothetical protein